MLWHKWTIGIRGRGGQRSNANAYLQVFPAVRSDVVHRRARLALLALDDVGDRRLGEDLLRALVEPVDLVDPGEHEAHPAQPVGDVVALQELGLRQAGLRRLVRARLRIQGMEPFVPPGAGEVADAGRAE